jgi:hypothetical protein
MTLPEATRQPAKRMQLTKLRAAPVLQADVPPCAPTGEADGGTASQLIRGVRSTSASATRLPSKPPRASDRSRIPYELGMSAVRSYLSAGESTSRLRARQRRDPTQR